MSLMSLIFEFPTFFLCITFLSLGFSPFSVIRQIIFVLAYIFSYFLCHQTNQISSMMIMTMMGLTPGPLIRALLPCVLKIMFAVSVAWGLVFLYQQELSPNVTFFCLSYLYQ